MVEVSRDGRRVYFTNSLYVSWDEQFYPDGIRSWMVKLDANQDGGMAFDPKFSLQFDGLRSHLGSTRGW
jgi:selenium-binding protein 1